MVDLMKVVLAFLCGLMVVSCQPTPPNYGWGVNTKFDDYINRDDGYWSYKELETIRFDNYSVTVYILNMTSQKWMDSSFTTCSIWWHYMAVAIPDEPDRLDVGAVFIAGGDNDDGPLTGSSLETVAVALFARDTKTVAGVVTQVPNQPCYFTNDPEYKRRSEDNVIAWSWKTFVDWYKHPTLNWYDLPLRNPMTKSATKAMDTIAAVAKEKIPGANIVKFVSSGASKRGWTAWSAAYGDRRVIATIPVVFSLLHMEQTVMAHYQAMGGGYSFALEPYYNCNLTMYLLDSVSYEPGGLFDYEDPYRYRARLNIPKLSIAGTGDEFFLNQDFNYWFNDMAEPRFMMMNPNAEHTLAPHYIPIYQTLVGFYLSVIRNLPMPQTTWVFREAADGSWGEIILYIDPDFAPVEVRAYSAVTLDTDDRRDYRLLAGYPDVKVHPIYFFNTTLERRTDNTYSSIVNATAGEWVAHFIEGVWEGPDGNQMTFTTQVQLVPESFNAQPCTGGADCYGFLT